MQYTIFEHLQLPSKGLRFFIGQSDTEKDSEFHKIVGHSDTIEGSQQICDMREDCNLPDISEVHQYYMDNSSNPMIAMFEMNNYIFARNAKDLR